MASQNPDLLYCLGWMYWGDGIKNEVDTTTDPQKRKVMSTWKIL